MSRYFSNNADYFRALREQYPPPHPAVGIAREAVAIAGVEARAKGELPEIPCCPVHEDLIRAGNLKPFDNCIACIRNQRDELLQERAEVAAAFREINSMTEISGYDSGHTTVARISREWIARLTSDAAPAPCQWCADGAPEWSADAKVWIHRRGRLDRKCENPPNAVAAPAAPLESPLARCARCHGTGRIRVKRGRTFDTDSADEIANAYDDGPCPKCAKPPLESRNGAVLAEFIAFCRRHPEQRFWQALRNWAGAEAILFTQSGETSDEARDTFHWEGVIRDEPAPPDERDAEGAKK